MKKFAALLTTVLVMAMSTATVFAAGSVTLNATVESNVAGTTTENASVAAFSTNTLGVTVNTVAADATKVVAVVAPNATSAELVGVAEVTYTGVIPAEGVAITLKVDGVKAGDNVKVIHYTSATEYEVLDAVAGDGTVTATFKSLSPVGIVKYTLPATTTPDTEESSDTTPVAPKTGVLPVAAMAAGICLAGAAVCSKKR